MATTRATPSEAVRALLSAANPATVTTLRADGTPHTTVVWVDWDGENLTFNTAVGRAKERHLRRDPRVSVCVIDGENMYRHAVLEGRAELVADGAREHADRLSRKYVGRDFAAPEGQERVIVRFRPERVEEYRL